MLFATAFLRAVCECEGGLPGAGRSPTGSAGSFGLRFATEGLTGTDRARRRAQTRAVGGCVAAERNAVKRSGISRHRNSRDGKPEGKAEGMTDSERSADPKGGTAYGIPIIINLSMP